MICIDGVGELPAIDPSEDLDTRCDASSDISSLNSALLSTVVRLVENLQKENALVVYVNVCMDIASKKCEEISISLPHIQKSDTIMHIQKSFSIPAGRSSYNQDAKSLITTAQNNNIKGRRTIYLYLAREKPPVGTNIHDDGLTKDFPTYFVAYNGIPVGGSIIRGLPHSSECEKGEGQIGFFAISGLQTILLAH